MVGGVGLAFNFNPVYFFTAKRHVMTITYKYGTSGLLWMHLARFPVCNYHFLALLDHMTMLVIGSYIGVVMLCSR